MRDERSLSAEYTRLAEEVLQEPEFSHILESDCTILFLESSYRKTSKGRDVLAVTDLVPDKWRWSVPADFTITVFESNCIGMTDEQMKILIRHELMHVGIDRTDTGEWKYSVIPHDVEDFLAIIEGYGLDWSAHERPQDEV